MFNNIKYLACILNLFRLKIHADGSLLFTRKHGKLIKLTQNITEVFNLIELDIDRWNKGFESALELVTYLESSPFYNSVFAQHRSILPEEVRLTIYSRPAIINSKSLTKEELISLYPIIKESIGPAITPKKEINKILHYKRLTNLLPEISEEDLYKFRGYIKRSNIKVDWKTDLVELYENYDKE
jgi:hypothetical protein